MTFKYNRSITRGLTWYCQSPGVCWKTDPQIGWELYYTDGPSWWLITSDGAEIDMGTRKLKEAMSTAYLEEWLKGRR